MTSILEKYKKESPEKKSESVSAKQESILDKYKKREIHPALDIAQQIPRSAIKGLGAYGNIQKLLHIQPEAKLTPSQQLQAEREATQPPEKLAEEIVETEGPPLTTGRLPTSQDIEEFLTMLGSEKGATSAGRIAGAGTEALTSGTLFGPTGFQQMLSVMGGMSGQSLREMGAPEWMATAVDAGINLADILKQLPRILQKTPKKKPSGLTERKFEKLEKPTRVTTGTKESAIEQVGKEFRDLAEDIQSSTNKSLRTFREDPEFEHKLAEGFENLMTSGKTIDKTVDPRFYNKQIAAEYKNIGQKGFELTPSERIARREIRRGYRKPIKKETKSKLLQETGEPFSSKKVYTKFTFNELVEQYRKNNKELRKFIPYGPEAVKNEAKRDALLAKNRAIAKTIEKEFGEFPEAQTFKFLNERWSDVQKIKTVDSFVNRVFTPKGINFKEAQKALGSGKKAQNLENALGKENVGKFRTLVNDLISQEKGMALLKAKGHTIEELGELGKVALFKPKYAKTKAAYDLLAKMWRRGLADPQFARNWKEASSLFNKGRIPETLTILNKMEKAMQEE